MERVLIDRSFLVTKRTLRKTLHNEYAYEKEITIQEFHCDSSDGDSKVV